MYLMGGHRAFHTIWTRVKGYFDLFLMSPLLDVWLAVHLKGTLLKYKYFS